MTNEPVYRLTSKGRMFLELYKTWKEEHPNATEEETNAFFATAMSELDRSVDGDKVEVSPQEVLELINER